MAEEKKYSGYGYHGGGRKPKGNDPKTTTMSFVCTAKEKELIDRLTKNCGLSRSQFIMTCIYFFEKSVK